MTGGDPWNDAVAGYATALRAAGRSPGTVRLRRHYLANLADVEPHPWRVTTECLQRFLARDGWAPETRKSARASVRSFYRWACRAGHVEVDPAAELDSVTVPAGTPRPAPEDVVRAAIAGCDARTGLMVKLATFAGLRAAEVARVHRRHLVGDVLRVYGKGGKVRDVPIVNAELLAELRRVDGWAFPNRDGVPMTPGHVTKLVSRALPGDWTAHTLRHRMGTQAYAGTRDLLAVQQLLGHARPETTQRYIRMPDDAVRAAVGGAAVL